MSKCPTLPSGCKEYLEKEKARILSDACTKVFRVFAAQNPRTVNVPYVPKPSIPKAPKPVPDIKKWRVLYLKRKLDSVPLSDLLIPQEDPVELRVVPLGELLLRKMGWTGGQLGVAKYEPSRSRVCLPSTFAEMREMNKNTAGLGYNNNLDSYGWIGTWAFRGPLDDEDLYGNLDDVEIESALEQDSHVPLNYRFSSIYWKLLMARMPRVHCVPYVAHSPISYNTFIFPHRSHPPYVDIY